MNIESDFDYLIKIALLGDATVGKTNLVIRFVDNSFSVNTPTTIGYDYKSKIITLNDSKKKKAKLLIWDTAGQERFMSLTNNIYKRVDGIILVYDIANYATFSNITNWIRRIKEFNDRLPVLIVGNKIDKNEERLVSFNEGENLANEYNMNFFETSALSGDNVDEAFISFSNEIMKYLKNNSNISGDSFSIDKSENKNKKKKKKMLLI